MSRSSIFEHVFVVATPEGEQQALVHFNRTGLGEGYWMVNYLDAEGWRKVEELREEV